MKVDVPAEPEGLPEMRPAALIPRPTGSEPLLTEKVYGASPPLAARLAPYDAPVLRPAGSSS